MTRDAFLRHRSHKTKTALKAVFMRPLRLFLDKKNLELLLRGNSSKLYEGYVDKHTTTHPGPSNAFSAFRSRDAQKAILGARFERPKTVNSKTWPSQRGIKAVGLTIIHYAGMSPAGVFFRPLDELVRETSSNKRTTQRALRALEGEGSLKRFPGGAVGRAQARAFVEDELGQEFPTDYPWRRSPTYVVMLGRSVRVRDSQPQRVPAKQPQKLRAALVPGIVLTDNLRTLHQAYCAERKARHGLLHDLVGPDVNKLTGYAGALESLATAQNKPFNVVCLDAMTEYFKETGYDGKLGELGHPIGWLDKYIEPIMVRLRTRYILARDRAEERANRDKEGPAQRAPAATAKAAAADVLAAIAGPKSSKTTPRTTFRTAANAPSMLAQFVQPNGESLTGEMAAPCSAPLQERGPP